MRRLSHLPCRNSEHALDVVEIPDADLNVGMLAETRSRIYGLSLDKHRANRIKRAQTPGLVNFVDVITAQSKYRLSKSLPPTLRGIFPPDF